MKTPRLLILALVALLLPSIATARVQFGLNEFPVSEFRDWEDIAEQCAAPAAGGFWCDQTDTVLTRIPTKGADFFFNDAGELLAVYAKAQKGQALGSYQLRNAQNLIPADAQLPGGAILVDGDYLPVEDADGSWQQVSDSEVEGRFTFRAGDLDVVRVVRVSNITHTLKTAVRAEGLDDDAGALQLAFEGIARQETPTVRLGQAAGSTVNPLSQPVADPAYISVHNTNRNSGNAIVMRPAGSADESPLSLDEATTAVANGASQGLEAVNLQNGVIAMQRPLSENESAAELAVDVYTGPNELVRYTQEGYAELPGLFEPNILGRLSVGIIWVLRYIQEFVNSWGLSIIVLTLLFRVLIWPLISTQTKSMFGMQALQPKIQALQKKYKDNREKLTEETMKLYREAGVNPAGGCLPILLQMPLFIILWRVFVNFEFDEGFLWIPDLGQADPLYILPALYVAVMVGMSWFSTRSNPNMFRQQMLINVIFVFILVGFPAGVILYFVVSMGVQVLQYWLLSRNRPQPQPAKGAR